MTTIRTLAPKHCKPGLCAVCQEPALLKWRDTELGLIGDCCCGAVVQADKNLQAARFGRPRGQFLEK